MKLLRLQTKYRINLQRNQSTEYVSRLRILLTYLWALYAMLRQKRFIHQLMTSSGKKMAQHKYGPTPVTYITMYFRVEP